MAEQARVDSAELTADLLDGKVSTALKIAAAGRTAISLDGTAVLPENLNEPAQTEADFKLALDAPSLEELTKGILPKPIAGAIKGGGTFGLHQQRLAVDFNLGVDQLKAEAVSVEKGEVKLLFSGDPQKPRSWQGELDLTAGPIVSGEAQVDLAKLSASLAAGKLATSLNVAATGRTAIALTGTATLPENLNELTKTEADFKLSLDAPALDELTAGLLPESLAGALKGGGTVSLHNQKVSADLSIELAGFQRENATVENLLLKLQATKLLSQPPTAAPLEGLASQVSAEVKGIQFGNILVDSAVIEATTQNQLVTLKKAVVSRAENNITLSATLQVPAPGQIPTGLAVELDIQAPKLERFGLGTDDTLLTGHLEGGGKLSLFLSGPSGKIQLTGGDFSFGGFKAEKFIADLSVANNELVVERLALEIDKTAQVALSGKMGLDDPKAFEGAALVIFQDLGVLEPLLANFGIYESLGGAVDFSAEAKGQLKTMQLTGQTKLSVDGATYGTVAIDELRLASIFTEKSAQTSELRLKAGPTSFSAGLDWSENRLRIKDIDLKQGKQQALTGYIFLPFEPMPKPQPVRAVPLLGTVVPAPGPIPFGKRIAANVNARELDIAELMRSLGKEAPAHGTVNMNLVLGGTLLKPTAHLKVEGRKLGAPAAAKLDGAELDLVAHYAERELTLDVTARQKEIQPLTIKGRIPLDLEAAVQTKKLDPNLPLDLTVKLPTSSLAFLPKVVPSIRSLEGKAGIDAHVGGTVQDPVFSGAVVVKMEYARLKSDGVPSINGLDIDIAFTEKSVKMRRFTGELGGGRFKLTGGIDFPEKITEPAFNLRLESDEVLVKRDDSITVRVDTDIKVTGNMEAGRVAGDVWVTHSRFFRDIDILPIALPGRPKPKAKPQPRAVASTGAAAPFSLPPPLKNWTFDINIATRDKDPFKIQGNLAKGEASVNLKFGGTGEAPWLDGSVQVDSLTASLPFSKLEIRRGYIHFTKEAFAEPILDITAESQLRNYRITAYISGPARTPEVSLTSEPPLPQQDIISLLATGTTIDELTGSGEAIASRAAILLFQQAYRKIFKKKDPTEGLPLPERLKIETGAVDSRTGQQEIQASFRLSDALYLIGDFDVTGEFTGRVRYLLRFK